MRWQQANLRQRVLAFAAAASLAVAVLLAFLAWSTWRAPFQARWQARSGATYFAWSGDGRLRLVRQAVSPATSGKFIADASVLDVETAGDPTSGRPLSRFRQEGGGPSWYGFQMRRNRWGWWCPPGTNGGLGTVVAGRTFVFDYWLCGAPYWFLIGSSLAPALFAARRRLLASGASRDRDPLRCPVCGYDLRATPDRCPECGAVPEVTPRAAA